MAFDLRNRAGESGTSGRGVTAMTATIFPFPRERVRASGTLPPERRTYYRARLTDVFSELRDSATGELVPQSECEEFARRFLSSIERARVELRGNKQ